MQTRVESSHHRQLVKATCGFSKLRHTQEATGPVHPKARRPALMKAAAAAVVVSSSSRSGVAVVIAVADGRAGCNTTPLAAKRSDKGQAVGIRFPQKI